MSIFNLFRAKHQFSGSIKTKSQTKFGFFSLKTDQVKFELTPTFDQIKQNLKAKCIRGKLVFCKFDDHDGKCFWSDQSVCNSMGHSKLIKGVGGKDMVFLFLISPFLSLPSIIAPLLWELDTNILKI
jgi:hypothetical protein